MSAGAAGLAYEVIAHFEFEAAAAITNSEKLGKAVDGLADSVEHATLGLQELTLHAAGLSLGQFSLISIFSEAIHAADKFNQYQIKIANTFQNAGFFKGPQAFQMAMEASSAAMENMKKVSQEFSLPASQLVDTATLIGAALTTKGLDNSGLRGSTDLARKFLKVAPMLGVDPGLASGELLGMIGGRTDIGGRLPQRLFADTKTLNKYNSQGGSSAFNKLPDAQRVQLLSKALGELGNNMEAAHAIANSWSGQLRQLKDNLFGIFSVFRELGETIMQPLIKVLMALNDYIKKDGAKIVHSISEVLGKALSNPEKMFANMMQAKNLRKDIHSGASAVEFGFTAQFAVAAFNWLKGGALAASPWIMAVGTGLHVFADALERVFPFLTPVIEVIKQVAIWGGIIISALSYFFGFSAVMTIIGEVLASAAAIAGTFLTVFVPLIILFQLLSRAAAIAQIADAKFLAENFAKLMESLTYFKNALMIIIGPLLQAFEAVAQFISPIFRFSVLVEILKGVMDAVTGVIAMAVMGFTGLQYAIMQFVQNLSDIVHGKLSPLSAGQGVADAYDAGMKDIYERIYGAIEKGDHNAVMQQTTNIGNVNINNQFKEQMEPDRVAFALKEQLMKSVANPTQARGTTFAGKALRE